MTHLRRASCMYRPSTHSLGTHDWFRAMHDQKNPSRSGGNFGAGAFSRMMGHSRAYSSNECGQELPVQALVMR